MHQPTNRTAGEDLLQGQAVIANIQIMQQAINGKHDEYAAFNEYSIEELFELQDKLMPEYNKVVKQKRQIA